MSYLTVDSRGSNPLSRSPSLCPRIPSERTKTCLPSRRDAPTSHLCSHPTRTQIPRTVRGRFQPPFHQPSGHCTQDMFDLRPWSPSKPKMRCLSSRGVLRGTLMEAHGAQECANPAFPGWRPPEPQAREVLRSDRRERRRQPIVSRRTPVHARCQRFFSHPHVLECTGYRRPLLVG
jgi:hypothetical protein